MGDEIKLSHDELEEIKDTIKFRTKVLEALKGLCGVPQKIIIIESQQRVQWWFIAGIIMGILSLAFRLLATK